jgi:hypothetical protein
MIVCAFWVAAMKLEMSVDQGVEQLSVLGAEGALFGQQLGHGAASGGSPGIECVTNVAWSTRPFWSASKP